MLVERTRATGGVEFGFSDADRKGFPEAKVEAGLLPSSLLS